jgi:hypothetical protein
VIERSSSAEDARISTRRRSRRVWAMSCLGFVLAGALAAGSLQVKISSPVEGADVQLETMVKGRVSDASAQVYVLVRPSKSSEWWVQQSPAPVNRDGSWQTLCYFGTASVGIGEDFHIVAIVTDHRLSEGQVLPEIPRGAMRSDVITVRRAERGSNAVQIQIAAPKQGAEVAGKAVIEGTVSDPKASIYVLVHPLQADGWWVQSIPAPANRDGSWRTLCYFGDAAAGLGEHFQIIAIATGRTLKEFDRLNEVPRDAAHSEVVTVKRAQ